MLKLAANLSMLFGDQPIEARFAHAADAGFGAVELQFPYAMEASAIADLLQRHDLQLALFNAPAGDVARGDRGLVLNEGYAFDRSIDLALDYLEATGCRQLHVLIGNGDLDIAQVAGRLRNAARRLDGIGATALIEPLNRRDQPDYALCSLGDAAALIDAIGEANVRLQFDAYHAAMRGEEPAASFVAHRARIGHVQVAAAADRGEPDDPTQQAFLAMLEREGWNGFVGAEYRPRGNTQAGLGWAARHGIRTVSPNHA